MRGRTADEQAILDRLRDAAETGDFVLPSPEREAEALRNMIATEQDPELRARMERRLADVLAGAGFEPPDSERTQRADHDNDEAKDRRVRGES